MLNPRHQKFVQEYIKNGGNGVAAAKSVYPNQSDESLRVTAHRLLTSANIREFVIQASNQVGITPLTAMKVLKGIMDTGKDCDKIAAVRTWSDLTGSFAPKIVREVNDGVPDFARDPAKIEEMLQRARKSANHEVRA